MDMALKTHSHQHSVKVIGSGSNLEQAFTHAIAGLTDPDGHYSQMVLRTFELTKIGGAFGPDGGTTVQVTLEAYASHKD
jgi:hypothetical protein